MMLAWHRALAHPQPGQFGDVNSTCSTISHCPFGNEGTQDCCPTDREGEKSDSQHSCRICEILWHDDVLDAGVFAVPYSTDLCVAKALAMPSVVCLDVCFSWSVRGPPSFT
jgi:hypothetical protein